MTNRTIHLSLAPDPDYGGTPDHECVRRDVLATAEARGYMQVDDLRPAALYKSALRALVGAMQDTPIGTRALAEAYERAVELLGPLATSSLPGAPVEPPVTSKVERCTLPAQFDTSASIECGGAVVDGVCQAFKLDGPEVLCALEDWLDRPGELTVTQGLCAALHAREPRWGEWAPSGLGEAVRRLHAELTAPLGWGPSIVDAVVRVRTLLSKIGTRDALDGSEAAPVNGGTGNCARHGVYKCPTCEP